MKNIGLPKCEVSSAENFTTETGMKIRRIISNPLRFILKKAIKEDYVLERYPELEKDKAYIFVPTHYFSEDIISAIATVNRPAYTLIGTTDQLEHNPEMYAAWARGLIYTDRWNDASRKEAVKKMAYILKNNISVILFAEGGWNNTENLLVQELFAGPYTLAKLTGAEVVPMSIYQDVDNNRIYTRVGDPIDLAKYDNKQDALRELRDTLGTMMYDQIEKYSTPIKRAELTGDIHMDHMERRCDEYWWGKDWGSLHAVDEEFTRYEDKNHPRPDTIRKSFDNMEINTKNAGIMGPILVRRKEDDKYNLLNYMHENYDKKKKR